MDVVLAVCIGITCIHFHDVEFAVGDGRMTFLATLFGIVAVKLMTGQAT